MSVVYIIAGKKLQKVEIPAKLVTSCCFGGKNNDELYVTCMGPEVLPQEYLPKEPLAGSLFRVTGLGVKGGPIYPFKPLIDAGVWTQL